MTTLTSGKKSITDIRNSGKVVFDALKYPDRKEEFWRKFDPSLLKLPENPKVSSALQAVSHILSESAGQSALLNLSRANLATAWKKEGFDRFGHVTDFASYLAKFPESDLVTIPESFADKFEAAHYAFIHPGYVVESHRTASFNEPVAIVSEFPDVTVWCPHSVIKADEGSQLRVFEDRMGGDDAQALAIGELKLLCRSGSTLEVVVLDRLGDSSNQLHRITAEIGDGATLKLYVIHVGGGLTKYDTRINLVGNRSTAYFYSVSLLTGTQVIDEWCTFNHSGRNSTGRMKALDITAGKSRSNFRGIIRVEKTASGTDSYLDTKSLILDAETKSESVPVLLISANDVKCKHSSTHSSLDKEQLFYFATRNIDASLARRMIVQGLVDEIVSTLKDEETRLNIIKVIETRIKYKM